MLNLPISRILALLTRYRYIIIFPIATVEGPIISAITGFLSAGHVFNPVASYLILVAADMFGDSIYYTIGLVGRNSLVERWGHKFGMSKERVIKMENGFKTRGAKLLIFGKTQPYGALILLSAGASKMDFKKFLLYNLAATAPKTLLFFLAGYLFGFTIVNKYLNIAGILSVVLGTALVASYFIFRKKFNIEKEIE